MSDPLFDTLFRPTTSTPSVASAAPVRAGGTRTRAGNAMGRTRAALLRGAARAVTTSGTRITMAQVAADAGVAKATLYNHFRTRDAVLDALLLDQVHQLVSAVSARPLEAALLDSADALSRHPLLSALARVDPAVLAGIARIDDRHPAWRSARLAVDDVVRAAGRGGTDTVLRWLASFLLSPADPAAIASDVAVLVAGLPVIPAVAGEHQRSA